MLRERFSRFVPKTIFTFSFDRYNTVTPLLLTKLEIARFNRAVIVSTPSSIKSFMLKFLELCHNLERQKNLVLEKKEKDSMQTYLSRVRNLLGLGNPWTSSSGELTAEEIAACRSQLVLCDKIFNIFRESAEIMDEVDIILHPLKSELNWPLGRISEINIMVLNFGFNYFNTHRPKRSSRFYKITGRKWVALGYSQPLT